MQACLISQTAIVKYAAFHVFVLIWSFSNEDYIYDFKVDILNC